MAVFLRVWNPTCAAYELELRDRQESPEVMLRFSL